MLSATSPFPDIEALEPDRAAVRELAAHIYSAQAELALKVARLDDDGGWAGDGYLSIVHWLTIHLGMGRFSARELVRVGHALVELPQVSRGLRLRLALLRQGALHLPGGHPRRPGGLGGAGPDHLGLPVDQDLHGLPASQGGRLPGAG